MPYRYPKVLLINVPDPGNIRSAEPLGLGYLAAYLRKHNFKCDIFDANSREFNKLPNIKIARLATKKKYGLVGMTVFTHLFYNTMNLAKNIKKLSPKTKIVFGGHHVTFTHQDVVKKYSIIDFIVRGEGELTLLDLARHMKEGKEPKSVLGLTYRSKNGIEVNPPRPLIKNLDDIPFPVRDVLKYRRQPRYWRGASILSSRGCQHRCSYCSISAFYKSQPGASYRIRSLENVVEEIEHLVKKFGIKQIAFKDDNMFVDARRLIKVTDMLISRGVSLTYNLVARADDIVRNERYLPILKKRGFVSAELGIEAGSEDVLKRFMKDISVDTNRKAIEILHKNNMFMMLDFIMFEPDMTLKDFRENIDFIKELGVEPFKNKNFVSGSVLQDFYLYPGTSYYERLQKEGRLKRSIFKPEWDFKDKNMQKIYKFISSYKKILNKKLIPLRKLRRERLLELNLRKKKGKTFDDRLKRGVLKHLDYEFDMLYLELLDKTLAIGEKFNFSKRGFSEVKKAMEERLETLKERLEI